MIDLIFLKAADFYKKKRKLIMAGEPWLDELFEIDFPIRSGFYIFHFAFLEAFLLRFYAPGKDALPTNLVMVDEYLVKPKEIQLKIIEEMLNKFLTGYYKEKSK